MAFLNVCVCRASGLRLIHSVVGLCWGWPRRPRTSASLGVSSHPGVWREGWRQTWGESGGRPKRVWLWPGTRLWEENEEWWRKTRTEGVRIVEEEWRKRKTVKQPLRQWEREGNRGEDNDMERRVSQFVVVRRVCLLCSISISPSLWLSYTTNNTQSCSLGMWCELSHASGRSKHRV